MKTISQQRATALIANSGGRIFAASVVKRTTGEPRRLVCRLFRRRDAKIAVDGANDQITVIDMEASRREGTRQFRTVALDRLERLTLNHNTYNVNG